jgi:hypothetical protein
VSGDGPGTRRVCPQIYSKGGESITGGEEDSVLFVYICFYACVHVGPPPGPPGGVGGGGFVGGKKGKAIVF